jgi:hypothetical protein
LDTEEQREGEDEVAAASRSLERVLGSYQRAFDVVVVDGLYLKAPFLESLHEHKVTLSPDQLRKIDTRAF